MGFVEEYRNQLPKKSELFSFSWWGIFCSVTSPLLTVLLFVFTPLSPMVTGIIFSIFFLVLLAFILRLLDNGRRQRTRNYRYAVLYMHIVLHQIRDFIVHLRRKQKRSDDLPAHIEEMLTDIEGMFSLATGKPCRLSIKSLEDFESESMEHQLKYPSQIAGARAESDLNDNFKKIGVKDLYGGSAHNAMTPRSALPTYQLLEKNTGFLSLWTCEPDAAR